MGRNAEEARAHLLGHRQIDGDGCWLWTLSVRNFGYLNVAVHRLAAHLWMGFDLASPLCVLHLCDKPRCFNPDHLFLGTKADNTADMMAKGRHRHEHVRIPDETIATALALVEQGYSQREAARRVGVSHSAVQDWIRR